MTNYKLIIDTETAGTLEEPYVFDIGGGVLNENNEFEMTFSLINSDVFYNKPLMETAYYYEKYQQYLKEIEQGERSPKPFKEIKRLLNRLIKLYNIDTIIAHNIKFDLNALDFTTQCQELGERFFEMPFTPYCTYVESVKALQKCQPYKQWCTENGYVKSNGTPRHTAEILYRWLKGDNDFTESHTAFEDTQIEVEIFKWLQSFKEKWD